MRKAEKRESQIDNTARTKAAAWAWYERGRGGTSPEAKSEVAAVRQTKAPTPSRFKTEAEAEAKRIPLRRHSFDSLSRRSFSFDAREESGFDDSGQRWDSGSSLFDTFELVSLSQHLDNGLSASVRKPIWESAASLVSSSNLVPPVAKGATPHIQHQKKSRFRLPKLQRLCRGAKELDVHDPKSLPRRFSSESSRGSEENLEYGDCKFEQEDDRKHNIRGRPRYRLSFDDIPKNFHSITLSPNMPLKQHEHPCPGYKQRYVHHHHHHHYLVRCDDVFTSADIEKSLKVAAASLRLQQIDQSSTTSA